MARKKKVKKKVGTRKARTPPFPAYPEWSTAKFWGYIRSGLRAKYNRWPPKFEVLNEARVTVTGQRHRYEYKCSICGEYFKQSEVEIDHIEPVGRLSDYDDLPNFVENLFCGKINLRVVCKPCHKAKTQEDRTNGEL